MSVENTRECRRDMSTPILSEMANNEKPRYDNNNNNININNYKTINRTKVTVLKRTEISEIIQFIFCTCI